MSEIRALKSGTLVEVEAGRASFLYCHWLVHVPSGDDAPCCEADRWREVECGGRLRMREGQTDPEAGFVCENGHIRRPIEEELAPFGPAWQDEQREREEEGY